MCLNLTSEIKFGLCYLQLIFMHLNSPTFSPLFTVFLLPQPPRSLSSSLALVSVMPASWVIGPESIPLRPLRKTSRGKGRERKGGTRDRNRERRKKREASGEPGERRGSGKEVFLSRSTAAQSHIQYFPLAGTHTHIHMHTQPCLHLVAGTTTAFGLKALGVCIRQNSSTSTKNIQSRSSTQLMRLQPSTLWLQYSSQRKVSCRIRRGSKNVKWF